MHTHAHAPSLSKGKMNKTNAITTKINSCVQTQWLSPTESSDAETQENLALRAQGKLFQIAS